jgi:predicted nucleic acid-binding protein
MKTTLDLPDELLIEAKTLAARRKTTLKAIVESALRREIRPAADDLADIYLLALAVKRGGRFATFDAGLDASLVPGGEAALLKL